MAFRLILVLCMAPMLYASAPRVATRVARFLDANGVERHGMLADDYKSAELIAGDAHGARLLQGEKVLVSKLLLPVDVSVIYAVGLNYPDHAHNVGNGTLPTSPIIFFKNRNAAAGPNDDVIIPPMSSNPDYEAELALVVSKDCKDISRENALDCVLGYFIANDVSARCWQSKNGSDHSASVSADGQTDPGDFGKCVGNGGQWTFSKGLDTHCPLGPQLVMKEELDLPDANGLQIQMHLNGKLMQNASTSSMVFGVREIMEFVTRGTTVAKGTVILTGTMGGVGDTRTPKVILQEGDNMTVTIDKLGHITNMVKRPKTQAPVMITPPEQVEDEAEEMLAKKEHRERSHPLATRIVRFMDAKGRMRYGHDHQNGTVELMVGEHLLGSRRLTGVHMAVDAAQMRTPVPKETALSVYGIGLNYADHTHQANLTLPKAPIVFFKNKNSITDFYPHGTVSIPPTSTVPDYEAELAIIMGKTCRDVGYDQALDCVMGYTAANDVSARCWQV
jgi:2-keto-4-pentenoate hydratase/2-oxohepta-3-ene-1,7-dioic acid hydratase in catechol pathway